MADELSRELADDEVPTEATEQLEEARTLHRRSRTSGRSAGGSEEKAGKVERGREPPTLKDRPALKPPPFQGPK
jgi:hypothetical protein